MAAFITVTAILDKMITLWERETVGSLRHLSAVQTRWLK